MKKNLKVYCFDLDGTLCTNTWGKYENAIPNKKAIKKLNELFEIGHTIIIYTSRYMGRFNSNVEMVYSFGYDFTKKQLDDWGVKYHELKMGKPSYDVIIDDKSFNYNNSWFLNENN